MDVATWASLSRLLDGALDLPAGQRTQWVNALGTEYGHLRPQLRRLLNAPRVDDTAFLETLPRLDSTRRSDTDAAPSGGVLERETTSRKDSPMVPTAGRYRILRTLGDGGMGAVWLAERADGLVKRPVALKLPRSTSVRGDLAARMARERDILASLDHPNIARLYDAGLTADGQPYLALEYVAGERIDEYVSTRGLSIRERLLLFLQVARAVANAHARLIVHRDLKPSNILVSDDGDVKLLDFGIAKLLDEDGRHPALTEMSGRPLTLDYASPEQVAGEPLDTSSDIYSLGVVLYELLAGVRPHAAAAASRRALERAILHRDPPSPSAAAMDPSTSQALRGDLDAIVHRALERRPPERYPTVGAFADDVERWLTARPVLARGGGPLYRCAKWARRNKAWAAAAACVLAAATAAAGAGLWQARAISLQEARAAEVQGVLAQMLREGNPYAGQPGAVPALEWLQHVRRRVDERLDGRPELRVELLNIVGTNLLMMQDTAAAETVLAEAVTVGTERLGVDHPHTIRARVLRTQVFRFRGQTTAMRQELERLLPLLRARQPARAEDLVIALKNQAHLELDEGQYDRAESAAREGAELAVAALGQQHAETIAAALMLAYTHQFTREPRPALAVTTRALRMAEAVYRESPRHPRVIEARHLYGRALAAAGELAQANEELRRAVEGAAAVFGPSSRMVGFFSVTLAGSQIESGDVDGAMASSRTAVEIIGQQSLPQSFRYANALERHGAALLAAGRDAEAVGPLARASAIVGALFPPSHAVRREYDATYALALARTGRSGEARRLLQDVVPAVSAPADPSAIAPLHAMAILERETGAYQNAIRLLERAQRLIPPGRPGAIVRMRLLTEFGRNLLALGSSEKALEVFERARAIAQRRQTHASPDRARIMDGLGRALTAVGRIDDACQTLRGADRIWREHASASRDAEDARAWLARCVA